jgi:hypothetical protein
LAEHFYGGFDTLFVNDEIADIDYRVNLTPLVGYYIVKNPDVTLGVDVGPGYLFEKVGGVEDDYFAPRIGDSFSWTISCTSKIYQKANITFDANDADNYLVSGEVGVESALNSLLSLTLLLRNTYDNVPALDRDKNDLALISGIKVHL